MKKSNFSQGIEKVIWLAALDEEFRGRLFADRKSALENCEVELTAAEQTILITIPDANLMGAIDRADVPFVARRVFLRGAVSTALAILVGTTALHYPGCSEEDRPSFMMSIGPILYPGDHWHTYGCRPCYLHVPDGLYQGSILIFYHGENQNAEQVFSEFVNISENENFLYCCPNWSGLPEHASIEAQAAGWILDGLCGRYASFIEKSKVYIGGFSTGAQVAMESALVHEDTWAGLVSWAGLLPNGIDPAQAPRTDLPVYLAAGDADTDVPAADVQALQAQLDGIGFQTNYAEFTGGHDIGIYDPQAAWDWISQFTNP